MTLTWCCWDGVAGERGHAQIPSIVVRVVGCAQQRRELMQQTAQAGQELPAQDVQLEVLHTCQTRVAIYGEMRCILKQLRPDLDLPRHCSRACSEEPILDTGQCKTKVRGGDSGIVSLLLQQRRSLNLAGFAET